MKRPRVTKRRQLQTSVSNSTQPITRDEWLAALGEAARPLDPGALTSVEIAQECGINQRTAERHIAALVAAGKAIRTVKWMPTAGGHQRRVAAYRLVKGA